MTPEARRAYGARYRRRMTPAAKEKQRAYQARYRRLNREELRAYRRSEAAKANQARWRCLNREKVRAAQARFKLLNREKVRAAWTRYQQSPHGQEARARWRQSERGEEYLRAYRARYRRHNPEKVRAGQVRYRESPRGRALIREYAWQYHRLKKMGPVRPEVLDALRSLRNWKRYLATGDPDRPIPRKQKKGHP